MRCLWRVFVLLLVVMVIGCNLIVGQKVRAASGLSSLTIGTVENLGSLDPADAGDVFSWEVLTHLYSGLTRQIPGSLRYELALAATHAVSNDGLVHTFTLKSGVTFDDGTPITPQAFADSIKRVLALQGKGSAVVAPYVKSAAVDSSGALLLTLNAPVPYLEQLLALPPYFAVNPADFPADRLNPAPQHLNSSGVYKLDRSEPGKSLTLVADPGFKGTAPLTPTITLRHYDSPEDLRRALLSHEVDIAWRGLPYDDARIAAQNNGVQLICVPGLQTFYMLIGQKEKPFDDPTIRQGMIYLLDRERVTQTILHDTARPLYSLLPPELADQATPAFPKFDLTQAKAILNKAGYSKYKTVESELEAPRGIYGDLYYQAVDQLGSVFARSEVIHLTTQDIDPKTVFDQIERGTFRLVVVGWTPVVPHPDAYLRPLLAAQLALGAHYNNPTMSSLLDKAALTSDPPAQADLYNQAQTLAAQEVVVIPLWQANQTLAAWKSVSGIVIEPNFLLRYDKLAVGS